MERKKRGSNYTAAEKELLMDLIKKHHHIIESKETNGHMILKKREAWAFVCQQYNAVAVSGIRKFHQLRHLYENIKQRSKKNNVKIKISNVKSERCLENTKELQKNSSNNEEEICNTGGEAYESTCTEQNSQILVMVTPKIEPLSNVYDDAASCFGDVEVNKNKDEECEIIETNITDDHYTTIPDKTVTNFSKTCTVTSNTPDERETIMTTVHQKSNKSQSLTSEISHEIRVQTLTKRKPKESNVKMEYFKTKLRNAKIENKYLINKIKMDREKHNIEMEILKIKLNKWKCLRKRNL